MKAQSQGLIDRALRNYSRGLGNRAVKSWFAEDMNHRDPRDKAVRS